MGLGSWVQLTSDGFAAGSRNSEKIFSDFKNRRRLSAFVLRTCKNDVTFGFRRAKNENNAL